MRNPFKFGTVVDGAFFTDREKELQTIGQLLESENHLVLIGYNCDRIGCAFAETHI